MAAPEQLKAMVEKLKEDEALYVLYLFRGRFAWYVEMFDFEDGKQWWDEEENGPLTHEAWREIVEACNKVHGPCRRRRRLLRSRSCCEPLGRQKDENYRQLNSTNPLRPTRAWCTRFLFLKAKEKFRESRNCKQRTC